MRASTSKTKKKRRSIAARLSAIYVVATLINLLIFYVAAGTNQIRLISEKIEISGRAAISQASALAKPLVAFQPNGNALEPSSIEKLARMLRDGGLSKNSLPLDGFAIVKSDGAVLFSYPDTTVKKLPPKLEVMLLKTQQKLYLKSGPVAQFSDLTLLESIQFAFLGTQRGVDVFVMTKLNVDFLQGEFYALIRLAVGIVLAMLVVQSILAWVIYRRFVLPVTMISAAANEMHEGRFTTVTLATNHNDELSTMAESFNEMSVRLETSTNQIKQNLNELKKKDDMLTRDLSIAEKIQAAVLPKVTHVRQVSAQVVYTPLMTVSGDYYDLIELSDGSVAIFIGDASGHGVPAAFLTIMAKIYFSSLVEKIRDPSELLREMNREISSHIEGEGLYLTAFYLRIYPNNQAEFCNCMHPEPILMRAGEKVAFRFESKGFFVGIFDDPPMAFETQKFQFETGDRLLLFTDGISEAMNAKGELLGLSPLEKALKGAYGKSLSETSADLMQTVKLHADGTEANDDATLLMLSIAEPVSSEASAMEQYRKRRFAEALREFSSLANADAANFKKWQFLRANCYIHLKHFPEAQAILAGLHDRESPDPQILLKLGICLVGQNQYRQALGYFELANQMQGESTIALAYQSLALYFLRRNREALEFLKKAELLNNSLALVRNVRQIITRQA